MDEGALGLTWETICFLACMLALWFMAIGILLGRRRARHETERRERKNDSDE